MISKRNPMFPYKFIYREILSASVFKVARMTTVFVDSAISATSAISAISATAGRDHVLIFPFLSKGHTIPLLHLATALCSRNIFVTFITTPAVAPFIHRHLSSIPSSNLRVLLLPFPSHPDLPIGVETTDALPTFSLFPTFLEATTSLREPFQLLLSRIVVSETPPLCLVSDFFFGWTLSICGFFGIPRLVFHGMSAFSMSIAKFLWNNATALAAKEPISVPGMPPSFRLDLADVPEAVRNSADPLDPATEFLNMIGEADVRSWGVILNSFAELESPVYVQLLESFYLNAAGGKTWLLGPLSLLAQEPKSNSESECITWLDEQQKGSVVYVAFGTQASVSDEQLDEVANGLVQAGYRFLWAVRSETWVPPVEVEELGRIERGWVPQSKVLSHASLGGFVSHCGWNSVLEAVSSGVPLLAFPMIAEQHLNSKMVAEVIGVGLRLPTPVAGAVVQRNEVEEGIRELMGGERGRRAREKAVEMAKKARAAMTVGGSSYQMLENLLDELRNFSKSKAAAVAATENGVVKNDATGSTPVITSKTGNM